MTARGTGAGADVCGRAGEGGCVGAPTSRERAGSRRAESVFERTTSRDEQNGDVYSAEARELSSPRGRAPVGAERRVYRDLAGAAFAFFSASIDLLTPAKSMYLPLQYAATLYHLWPGFTPCSIGSPLRLNLR